jgi:hypothetical protein
MKKASTTKSPDGKILKALYDTELSTSEIAAVAGITKAQAYSRCRKLEDAGFVSSSVQETKRLLYCVDCQEVVTAENYESCRADEHDMRTFYAKVRFWTITSSGRRTLGSLR